MEEEETPIDFIRKCWVLSSELITKGLITNGIHILETLLKKQKFSGLALFEVKTRVRLGNVYVNFTTEYKRSLEILLKANTLIEEIQEELKRNRQNKENEMREANTLHLNCLNSLFKSYFYIHNSVMAKKVLKKGIALAKEIGDASWNSYYRIELLKIFRLGTENGCVSECLIFIEDCLKNCGDNLELNVIYNVIKMHVIMEHVKENRKIEEMIEYCESLFAKLLNFSSVLSREEGEKQRPFVLTKENYKKSYPYWEKGKNYNFLLLVIYFNVLKFLFYLEKTNLELSHKVLKDLEIYYLILREFSKTQPISSPGGQGGPLSRSQNILWVRPSPMMAIFFLLATIDARSCNDVDFAEKQVQKGLNLINHRMGFYFQASKGYQFYIELSEEVLQLQVIKISLLFNKVLNSMAKGELKTSVAEMVNIKNEMMKNSFLYEKNQYNLQLLIGLYAALVRKDEIGRKHLNWVVLNSPKSQRGSWAKLFLLSIDVSNLEKNVEDKKLKADIFDKLDRYNLDPNFKDNVGLSSSIAFLRGAVCLLTGVKSDSEQYLRHSLYLSVKGLKNVQFSTKVLTLLGNIYAQNNTITTAKQCFSSAIIRGAKMKDVFSQFETFKLINKNITEKKNIVEGKRLTQVVKERFQEVQNTDQEKEILNWFPSQKK